MLGDSITACTCPQPIGPTGSQRCVICQLPLLCPNCGGCRGCKLAAQFGWNEEIQDRVPADPAPETAEELEPDA